MQREAVGKMLESRDQIDSNTIDGSIECVHSQYICILTSQASTQFLCLTKLSKVVIFLE